MIREETGKICDGLYSLGYHFIPAFLMMSTPPVLFDACLTVAGPQYLNDLTRHLTDADRLSHIFLTHAHFDHCGAIPFLKRNIKNVKIAASRLSGEILKKPNAIKLIKSLNGDFESQFEGHVGDVDISFEAFEVDVPLDDGDIVDLGEGWTVRVIATPGHTRDSVSYYIPRLRALIPGEATGVLNGNYDVQPEFSSSYTDYVNSLEKLATLDVEYLLLPHIHVLTGQDAKRHIQKSLSSAQKFKAKIDRYIDRFDGDQEAVVSAIFKEEYEDTGAVLQDRRSYLLNLTAKVKTVTEGK
jgi:glyoxylase-like metal-dependent hydrolase (beta-lactamase superfamily II)